MEEVWLDHVYIHVLGLELKPGGTTTAKKVCICKRGGCRKRDVLQDLGKSGGKKYSIKRVTAERRGQAYESHCCRRHRPSAAAMWEGKGSRWTWGGGRAEQRDN